MTREEAVLVDTVEYHLEGQAMYQAINKCRAAISAVKAEKEK